MLFVCHPKILHKHCLQFSWELKWPQEKLKTMLMQNLGWQTKAIMVCCGIFWSGQFIYCRAKKLYLVSKIEERELGEHVFQDLLKNNYLQGNNTSVLLINDHQLWTKHERQRDQKAVHCYMYNSRQYLLASDLPEFHINQWEEVNI